MHVRRSVHFAVPNLLKVFASIDSLQTDSDVGGCDSPTLCSAQNYAIAVDSLLRMTKRVFT